MPEMIVSLPDENLRRLRRAAAAQNKSPESLVVEAIDTLLPDLDQPSLVRHIASLPVADRQVLLNAKLVGSSAETAYDRDWVDLDEDYGE